MGGVIDVQFQAFHSYGSEGNSDSSFIKPEISPQFSLMEPAATSDSRANETHDLKF
jgi:hypothetical protein